MTDETRRYWDAQAATFDDGADHGLRDPGTRRAWAELLLPLLPATTSTASTCPPAMVAAARAKLAAAGAAARFSVGDAAAPPVEPGSVDVVLARHVLWAFEEPAEVLASWIALLAPGGRLVLVEGRWSTGAGLSAGDCAALVRGQGREARVRLLTDPVLWGKEIDDERYVLTSPADITARVRPS